MVNASVLQTPERLSMSLKTPLVVAILHSEGDDMEYRLYCEAYGIEMQVDNEWNAEAILLAPHDYLYAVTENTDVTGEDAAIISAGVTDVPISDKGTPSVTVIKAPKNNWLLLGDPRRNDTDEIIATKLKAALDAGCRVIICLTDTGKEQIAARTLDLTNIDGSRIVFALAHPDGTNPSIATSVAQHIHEQIVKIGMIGNPRFIVSGEICSENIAEILGMEGVDGVFLMDDQYDDFGTILELLRAVG